MEQKEREISREEFVIMSQQHLLFFFQFVSLQMRLFSLTKKANVTAQSTQEDDAWEICAMCVKVSVCDGNAQLYLIFYLVALLSMLSQGAMSAVKTDYEIKKKKWRQIFNKSHKEEMHQI